MVLCILCNDDDLTQVKQTASDELGKSANILNIPVSESGELPATHWFCCLHTNKAGYNEYKAVQNLTIMELNNPKDFLAKHNLKKIIKTEVKPANPRWS
jgi:hypothetical protein